ncbi:hypothetical protein TVNIR_2145 [Thioalkalivibrio nitratireducens DSM 14787]|uniref:Phage tail sheath protein FI n=1 Tax=Thioalkalivibrio nitratireducens (strain DSM 14787 / UNIQEM 213 / ALEN2) TaxID=1255043 RepID=L0DZI2_THIND|nr:hypothetical protein [Thioalkalivibrio nitratireducens]AGA33801.1 hypothetical protein TVNIR_2145 [Thioalkalivibrio nitratireducens DSM 14787]
MELLQQRIRVAPRPPASQRPVLPVLLLGHAPGRVRRPRIPDEALEQMRSVGLGPLLEERLFAAPEERALCHLPLPLNSVAEFDDIFPDAREAATDYRSILAGRRAWLPQAVTDFFANGGERLWVLRIPEDEAQAGFLPSRRLVPHDLHSLRGIALLLSLPEVGVVALPDLERLQIPANLPDIPRMRLANAEPPFLPCGTEIDNGHRERRNPGEIEHAPPPLPTGDLLRPLQYLLARHRPDVQCLFTLPLAYSDTDNADRPGLDPAALADIEAIKASSDGPQLRRLQLLFPYLRGAGYRLVSSVGALAGLQAGGARRRGIWRSVAGLPMRADARPYPAVTLQRTLELRERPGIGVLQVNGGRVHLDDERLAVPALPPDQYTLTGRAEYRSGEVARFMGFLLRQLRALGEVLVFNVDHRDPRPRLLLEDFFRRLYRQGALRGRKSEDAYRIRQITGQDAVIIFEIEVAPAFPIDRIHIAFVHRGGDWTAELRT